MTKRNNTAFTADGRDVPVLSEADREILIKQALILGDVKAQRGSVKQIDKGGKPW